MLPLSKIMRVLIEQKGGESIPENILMSQVMEVFNY
jgi:hypothetical protein